MKLKRWGQDDFNIDRNPWVFISLDDLLKDKKKYGITTEIVKNITKDTKSKLATDLTNNIQDQKEFEKIGELIKQQNDEVDEIKGVFVIPEDLSKEKEVL